MITVDLLLFKMLSDFFMRFKPRRHTSFLEKDPGVTFVLGGVSLTKMVGSSNKESSSINILFDRLTDLKSCNLLYYNCFIKRLMVSQQTEL